MFIEYIYEKNKQSLVKKIKINRLFDVGYYLFVGCCIVWFTVRLFESKGVEFYYYLVILSLEVVLATFYSITTVRRRRDEKRLIELYDSVIGDLEEKGDVENENS